MLPQEAHTADSTFPPRQGQGAVAVQVPGCKAPLSATFSKHTISGPVLGVGVAQRSAHRDALISAWQSALQQSAR